MVCLLRCWASLRLCVCALCALCADLGINQQAFLRSLQPPSAHPFVSLLHRLSPLTACVLCSRPSGSCFALAHRLVFVFPRLTQLPGELFPFSLCRTTILSSSGPCVYVSVSQKLWTKITSCKTTKQRVTLTVEMCLLMFFFLSRNRNGRKLGRKERKPTARKFQRQKRKGKSEKKNTKKRKWATKEFASGGGNGTKSRHARV